MDIVLDYSIKYGSERDIDLQDAIGNGLNSYNAQFNTNHLSEVMNVYVKDSEGKVVGGLIGTVWLQWLNVQILWVDEAYRKQRIGSKILQLAERDAIERGNMGIYLDTLSYQAKGFYEKQGYSVFGVLEGFPKGYTRYFFQKRLPAGFVNQ